MKVTTIMCDLCGSEIIDEPFVLPTDSNKKKQVGCDIVLTPRGNRVHTENGLAMIRVNASFYCGSHPANLEELHFHSECLDTEVKKRIVRVYSDHL